jgi:hypothetical protein
MTLVKRSAKMSPYEGDSDVEREGTEEGLPREDDLRGQFDQVLDCYG